MAKNSGFFEKVYAAVERVPKGRVTTYGQIARALGCPTMAKFVGYALHVNPRPVVVPCHRVLNRMGETSGAFAFGGGDVQRAMLEAEGVIFEDGRVDIQKFGIPDSMFLEI